jgi:hypothetical protein
MGACLSMLEEKWDKFMLDDNRHWLFNYCLNIMDKCLPESGFVKEFAKMPSFPMYVMAFTFNLMWWTCFLYFIVVQYISGLESSFISLDPSSGDCTEVPFSLDGTYLADSSGHWDSQKKYNDATAIYSVDVLGYASTKTQYEALIGTTVGEALKEVGETGARRDLAYNMIAWTAWSYPNRDYGKFTFAMSGEISTMLNRQYFLGGMVLNKGMLTKQDVCLNSETSSTTFDAVSGSVKFAIQMSDAVETNNVTISGSSKSCQRIARSLGYRASSGSTDYVGGFNVNSFASAVAVNYDIMSAKSFVQITDSPTKGYVYSTDDDSTGGSGSSYYSSSNEDDGLVFTYSGSYGGSAGYTDDLDDYTETYSYSYTPSNDTRRALSAEDNGEHRVPSVKRGKALKDLKGKLLVKNHEILDQAAAEERMKSEAEAHPQATTTSTTTTGSFLRFYDPKYAQMDPIYCFFTSKTSTRSACFLQLYAGKGASGVGAVYAYPVMKHYENTSCANMTNDYTTTIQPNGTWAKKAQHNIDMLLGLIVFPSIADAKSFAADSIKYRNSSSDGDLVIPERLHAAMAAIIDNDGEATGYKQADICGYNSTGYMRNCFLMTFNAFGPGYYINSHNYQLFAGACRNSLYNAVTFKGITRVVPQPLVQTYVQGTLKPWDSFYQALGFASGNADIYTRWAFYLLMGLCVYVLYVRRGYNSEIFEFTSPAQEERDAQQEGAKDGAIENAGSGGEEEIYPAGDPSLNKEPYTVVPSQVVDASSIEMVEHRG